MVEETTAKEDEQQIKVILTFVYEGQELNEDSLIKVFHGESGIEDAEWFISNLRRSNPKLTFNYSKSRVVLKQQPQKSR